MKVSNNAESTARGTRAIKTLLMPVNNSIIKELKYTLGSENVFQRSDLGALANVLNIASDYYA